MDCFVYGTLTDPDRAASVLDAFEYRGDAVLDGMHRVEGTYPTLAPGDTVSGKLLRTADIGALDRYEGVERGLYVRVSVPFEDVNTATAESETAAVYVGNPDALSVAGVSWPGSGSFRERVERYVREKSVSVCRE
jgi:gamma-glutamylcyclotransferase (GGCT)/AIG2-like uncharacterized protein YtfP